MHSVCHDILNQYKVEPALIISNLDKALQKYPLPKVSENYYIKLGSQEAAVLTCSRGGGDDSLVFPLLFDSGTSSTLVSHSLECSQS